MPTKSDYLLDARYQCRSGLSLTAVVENFPQVESWLDDLCDQMAVAPKIRMQLQIMADEIFTNICSYAYPEASAERPADVSCAFEPVTQAMVLVFADHGIEFNPLTTDTEAAAHRHSKKGGVGLLMIRKLADSLRYERRNGQNILMLTKRIGGGSVE